MDYRQNSVTRNSIKAAGPHHPCNNMIWAYFLQNVFSSKEFIFHNAGEYSWHTGGRNENVQLGHLVYFLGE